MDTVLDEEIEYMKVRILDGVLLLDQKCPGWRDRIDRTTLNMADPGRCIIGQLFGQYSSGLEDLDVEEFEEATRLGFDILTEDYDQLQRGWAQVIWGGGR